MATFTLFLCNSFPRRRSPKRGNTHDIKDICPRLNNTNQNTGWHTAYHTVQPSISNPESLRLNTESTSYTFLDRNRLLDQDLCLFKAKRGVSNSSESYLPSFTLSLTCYLEESTLIWRLGGSDPLSSHSPVFAWNRRRQPHSLHAKSLSHLVFALSLSLAGNATEDNTPIKDQSKLSPCSFLFP